MPGEPINDLSATAIELQPLQPTIRLERRIDLEQVTMMMVAQTVDGAPELTGTPSASGQVLASSDGSSWFVPVAVLPKMSATSETPHVFIDDVATDGRNGWVLKVAIDLVRPEGVAPEAKPLPVDGLSLALSSSTSLTFTELVDAVPPDETVLRRVMASAAVDRDAIVAALSGVSTATLAVAGTVHYRTPAPPSGGGGDETVIDLSSVQLQPRIHDFIIAKPIESMTLESMAVQPRIHRISEMNPKLARIAHRFRPIDIFAVEGGVPTPVPAEAVPASQQLALTPGGAPLSAYFPKEIKAYRRIYAKAVAGISGDADAVWVSESTGMWREAVVPNQFYVTPDEYRLALDPDTGLPAMSVLLVKSNQPDGKASYKVRATLKVAPWLDPVRAAKIRGTIAQREFALHPQLVIGGAESASFISSGALSQLGGSLLAPGGAAGELAMTIAVAPSGFSLDFDCTLEFYTLLCQLLAGTTGSGLRGEVRMQLRTGDGPTDTRDFPVAVALRLDRLADPLLAIAVGPPPAPDATSLQVTVSNLSAYPVDVATVMGTLLATLGEPPTPVDTSGAVCSPAALSLPGRGDAAASATISLTADDDLDLETVDSIELAFAGTSVKVKPAEVLDRVHEVAASGSITSTVKLRSYLMQHPDQLPPGLTDVFGLEVQIARGSGTPVSVFVTRDEPEKTVDIAFGFTDLVAGMSPDSPELKVRRRNMIPTGTSGWGEWETTVGRELFIAPVLPGAPGQP
ncbi:MAG: hypothetical protein Q7V88_15460 [Actinomycetota bacterium]|nr:hypothetical protein [Actinomycetota bacterium]